MFLADFSSIDVVCDVRVFAYAPIHRWRMRCRRTERRREWNFRSRMGEVGGVCLPFFGFANIVQFNVLECCVCGHFSAENYGFSISANVFWTTAETLIRNQNSVVAALCRFAGGTTTNLTAKRLSAQTKFTRRVNFPPNTSRRTPFDAN